MVKSALALATSVALLRMASPSAAQTRSPGGAKPAAGASAIETTNRIVGYTGWDSEFLYIALQVNKPNIVGNNTEAFSHPLEDDAVIVSIETDNGHKELSRTARTVTVAVSAAHGAQLYSGADAKPLFNDIKEPGELLKAIAEKYKDDPLEQKKQNDTVLGKIFKYEVQQRGIPRKDNSFAPGYTVELAIPWLDLGVQPKPGVRLGFNVVAQSKSAGSPPIQSLASGVKGSGDIEKPSLWNEIVLSEGAAPTAGTLLTVPRIPVNNKPELNGELTPGEWNGLSLFEFGELATARTGKAALESTLAARNRLEFIPRPSRPAVPISRSPVVASLAPLQSQKVTPLVLATYEYHYQGDPRKSVSAAQVSRADNSSLLAHHPLEGSGPWFSFDRADWHRKQLAEARREGVDVLLPVYRGSPRERQFYADKGLNVLVAALQSMRDSGQDYPQIGLYLDTDSLIEALGDRPNLHEPAAFNALYGMIRDYYRRIPAQFRCGIPLNAANGGRLAYPVFLSSDSAFKELDAALAPALRGRFAADFPGCDLLIVGAKGFDGKANLEGFFADSRAKEAAPQATGWLKIATVSAGYSERLTFADSTLPARRDSDAYRTLWTAAVNKSPDWIFLDGWNDYTNGREITPSLEAGFSLADTTLFLSRMFAGASKQNIRLLSHDVPSSLAPGSRTAVQLRIQNAGLEGWGGVKLPAVGLAYRWRDKNGRVTAGETVPFNHIVLAGQNITAELTLTAGSKNAAIATGDYTLEIAHVLLDKNWAMAAWPSVPGSSIDLPIHIGQIAEASAWAASLMSSDLPPILENGGLYEVNAALRNDGTAIWRKADSVRIGARLYSTREIPNGRTETPLATPDASAVIDRDVQPGEIVKVRFILSVGDVQGVALPEPESGAGYEVRWEVAPGAGAQGVIAALAAEDSTRGTSFAPQPVSLVDFDFGVHFTQDITPAMLPGGKRLPVRISIQNVGTQTWRKDQVRVGTHWYYQDGTEYFFENETTPLGEDVTPGGRVKDMIAWVTAPPGDGNYWMVWDVKFGDTWASTTAGTRTADSIVRPIQVIGDKQIFTDLTKAYNIIGASDAKSAATGNFDGQGHSFPASLLPPYPDMPVMPGSMWLASDRTGPESPRRIGFRWGPKDGTAKNMISCRGQRVELGKSAGFCHYLHILAASDHLDKQVNLKLIFEEPTGTSEDLYSLSVSPWDHPGENKDEIAVLAPWHHERAGTAAGAVALYHYVIKIRDPRKLSAIQMPLVPEVKIAAITLEK